MGIGAGKEEAIHTSPKKTSPGSLRIARLPGQRRWPAYIGSALPLLEKLDRTKKVRSR